MELVDIGIQVFGKILISKGKDRAKMHILRSCLRPLLLCFICLCSIRGVDNQIRTLRIQIAKFKSEPQIFCIKEIILESLGHDVGTVKGGKPIADNICRPEPTLEPPAYIIPRHKIFDVGSLKS